MDEENILRVLDDLFSEYIDPNESKAMEVDGVEASEPSPRFWQRTPILTQRFHEPAVASTSAACVPRPMVLHRVEITEQPVSKMRFRYESENTAGYLIYGVRSTRERKTFVTIRINNYIGPVLIIVSCVDKYKRAHPNTLATEGCKGKKSGICIFSSEVTANAKEYTFKKLGITLVKIDKVKEVLQERKKVKVDPFGKGFDHAKNPKDIDREAVRLAFQVYEYKPETRKATKLLACVTSDVIYHEKDSNDPEILHYSTDSVFVAVKSNVFIFCRSTTKDTKIIFFEKNNCYTVIWSRTVEPWYVGRGGYIVEAPPYDPPNYNPETRTLPIKTWFCLMRKDISGTTQYSKPKPLNYLPTPGVRVKRKCNYTDLLKRCESVPSTSNRDFLAEAREWHGRNQETKLPADTEAPKQSPSPISPYSTPDIYQNLAYNQPSTSYQAPAHDQACSPYQDSINDKPVTEMIGSLPGSSRPSSARLRTPPLAPSENQVSENHNNNVTPVSTSFDPKWNQDLVNAYSPLRSHLGSMLSNVSTNEESPTTWTNE